MNGFVSPYLNPYMMPQQTPQFLSQGQNVLPSQQILQANGKASIDALQMAPNSSVLIVDTTAPIVWKCVSDSLGNVTSTPYDISEHKEVKAEEIQASLVSTVNDINERLRKVESDYESFIKPSRKYESDKADVGNVQKHGKSSSNDDADVTEHKPTVQKAK